MKKITVLLICGIGFILQGTSPMDVHHKNIKSAITRFSSVFTNDMMSTDCDFTAILGEMENLKSEVVRTNLMADLADQLIVNRKDMWKHNDALWFQRRRTYLMGKAMRSLGEGNLMFRWRKYTDLLQAMKTELALYEDVKHPDAYRDRWIALAKEDLRQRIKELGTNKNIIISGLVPISKEEREINEKWAYKKSLECQISRYEKNYFDSLKLQEDYRKLPKDEQKRLLEMVKEGLGRYPKWYQKELEEKKADMNTAE